jgi:hypothetical protein
MKDEDGHEQTHFAIQVGWVYTLKTPEVRVHGRHGGQIGKMTPSTDATQWEMMRAIENVQHLDETGELTMKQIISGACKSPASLPTRTSRRSQHQWKILATGLYRSKLKQKNNNNTFTWSGPSGVLGCTGQRRLGRVAGRCSQGDGCRAVPLNAAEEKELSFGDITRSCRHCFEGSSGCANAFTTLRQTMTVCGELRIREDRLA